MATEMPRLLIVEDNSETRLLLRHLLDSRHEINFASSYKEGLEVATSTSFDLYVLDINLRSEEGGTELLHEIRAQEGGDGAPAMALTAYAMPGDREELLNAGFDKYLSKPFSKANLNAVIDEVLPSGESADAGRGPAEEDGREGP